MHFFERKNAKKMQINKCIFFWRKKYARKRTWHKLNWTKSCSYKSPRRKPGWRFTAGSDMYSLGRVFWLFKYVPVSRFCFNQFFWVPWVMAFTLLLLVCLAMRYRWGKEVRTGRAQLFLDVFFYIFGPKLIFKWFQFICNAFREKKSKNFERKKCIFFLEGGGGGRKNGKNI